MSECDQWSNSYWRVRHQRSSGSADLCHCVTTLKCPDLSNVTTHNHEQWSSSQHCSQNQSEHLSTGTIVLLLLLSAKINCYYIFWSSSSGLHNASSDWPRKLRDLGDEEDERWWGPEHVQHVLTLQRYEQYPAGAGGGHHQTDQEHESSSSTTSS